MAVTDIPTSNQVVESHTGVMVNLGYYVKSSEILEFKNIIKEIFLSSNPFPFTTNRQYQLAQACSDLPQSVILEHIIISPKFLAKQGISGQFKENKNNDKNTFHLPRQCTK